MQEGSHLDTDVLQLVLFGNYDVNNGITLNDTEVKIFPIAKRFQQLKKLILICDIVFSLSGKYNEKMSTYQREKLNNPRVLCNLVAEFRLQEGEKLNDLRLLCNLVA